MEEYRLTEADIKTCIAAFEDLDDDQNGYISTYDFQTALSKIGISLTQSQLAKSISELDIKNTGCIRFSDFMEIYRRKRTLEVLGENESDTLDAYVAIGGPEDKSGHINASILVQIIKEEFQLPINIEKLIQEIDDSGNGEIEFEEFENLLRKKYTHSV